MWVLSVRLLVFCATIAAIAGCQSKTEPGSGVGEVETGPPVVVIEAPATGSLSAPIDTVRVVATVSDDRTTPDALALVLRSSIAGELDTETRANVDGTYETVVVLESGDHVLTLTAEDEDGNDGQDAIELVVNARPSAPIVRIDPEGPIEGEKLAAAIEVRAGDPEGDPVSYAYAWSFGPTDGDTLEPYPMSTDEVVPVGITERGQTWWVTVTPSDAYGAGESAEASVAIVNQVPSFERVIIEPEEPRTADDLVVTLIGWADPDGDPETARISWFLNGELVPDETTTTLAAHFTQRGDEVSVSVVPWDGYEEGVAVIAGPVVVLNTAPEVASADLSPYTPLASEDLRVSTFAWFDEDEDPEQYRYRWYINETEYAGVTGDEMTAEHTASGDSIYVDVIPFDGIDEGSAVRSNTVSIDNSIPSITGVELTPTNPDTTQDITAIVVGWSDTDGDPARYDYRWFVNGVEYTSSIENVFPATLTTKGDGIFVEVTPLDDSGDGASVVSATVTVVNTLPGLVSVELVPSTPITTDDVQAVVSGWLDLDGEPESLRYDWTINGLSFATELSFVSALETLRGDEVQVTVTPFDSDGDGVSLTATPVLVRNSPPTLTEMFLTPETPITEDTLSCAWAGYADLDGDPDGTTLEWTVNGVPAGTGPTLAGVFTSGDEIQCTVTAFDGTDVGTVLSKIVTVDNTQPRIVSVSITPDPAYTGDGLSCAWAGFWDPDGDTDMSSAAWTINGSPAGAGTSLSGGFVHGDLVACTVTPSDGSVLGVSITQTLTISNSLPAISWVSIAPTSATVSDVLTCNWGGFSDADGEVEASTVEWIVNSTTAGFGTTLAGAFVGGDTVTCTVTPHDGTDAGTPVFSGPLTIANTPPVLAVVYLAPDPPDVTDTMTCTPGSITDADGTSSFTYTYEWWVAGGIRPGETGTTLSPGSFARSQTIHCEVTPHDGHDAGAAVPSNIVTVENSRPTITALVVTPAIVYTNDTLTASVSASDLDGDTVFLDFVWMVDGIVVLSGPTVNSLSGASHFDKHASIQVAVTPNDGADEGVTVVSDPLTVLNSPPESATIEIVPSVAEPEDDLECLVSVDASDADGDTVSYDFDWFVDGAATSFTGATVPASATTHGERWECTVTPYDGEDVGSVAIDSVTVNDFTNPDPPVIDAVVNHSNDVGQTLEGDCEADCTVTVYCDDDTGTDVYTAVCDSLDRFSRTVTLTSGEVNECYATCTDSAGNTSGASDVVSVEVCEPVDVYESDDTYGDSPSDVIDEWSPLADDGSATISIIGNVLDDDTDDWYLVQAIDNLAEDLSAGSDAFDFQVEMTTGTGEFRFVVHKGGTGAGELECPAEDGYTDYNWFNQDKGEGAHTIPADTRACGWSTSTTRNECQDDSDDFYIHVFRLSGTPVTCQNYRLDITNGM